MCFIIAVRKWLIQKRAAFPWFLHERRSLMPLVHLTVYLLLTESSSEALFNLVHKSILKTIPFYSQEKCKFSSNIKRIQRGPMKPLQDHVGNTSVSCLSESGSVLSPHASYLKAQAQLRFANIPTPSFLTQCHPSRHRRESHLSVFLAQAQLWSISTCFLAESDSVEPNLWCSPGPGPARSHIWVLPCPLLHDALL